MIKIKVVEGYRQQVYLAENCAVVGSSRTSTMSMDL
jgi:hypothetical protein